MECVLREELWKISLIYINDIITYSQSFEEHMQHIKVVFKRIQKANLRLIARKYPFANWYAKFLRQELKCDPYLHGKQSTTIADHRPINWLLKTQEPTGKLMRWAMLL